MLTGQIRNDIDKLWKYRASDAFKAKFRVWVNTPGTGYVRVAEIRGHAVMADEFITSELNL